MGLPCVVGQTRSIFCGSQRLAQMKLHVLGQWHAKLCGVVSNVLVYRDRSRLAHTLHFGDLKLEELFHVIFGDFLRLAATSLQDLSHAKNLGDLLELAAVI
jgi:hypothetical protein